MHIQFNPEIAHGFNGKKLKGKLVNKHLPKFRRCCRVEYRQSLWVWWL